MRERINFSNVIKLENLKFGTKRLNEDNEVEGLPSLYFLDGDGHFVRIRPYHDSHFAIIKKGNRTIFFITDEEYGHYRKNRTEITGKELERLAPGGSKYDGTTLRTGDTYRVVDYTDPNNKPHKGHYLTNPGKIREIYESMGINLNSFIEYCAEEDTSGYRSLDKDDILDRLKEDFPLS